MCGKAKSSTTPSRIETIINNVINNVSRTVVNCDNTPLDKPDNIVPGNMMHVAHIDDNELHISQMKWGLIGYAGNFNRYTFNTRLETAKKIKNGKQKRAIIFIDGYYESKAIDSKKPKTAKNRETYFITNKQNMLIVPVFYSVYKDGSMNFTILTKASDENIEDIHERQPVVLNEKTTSIWLDSSIVNREALSVL